MGAWGTGSFDNDTAMDWAANVKTIDDILAPIRQSHLKMTTQAEHSDCLIDTTLSEQTIAAVSALISMNFWANPQIPGEFLKKINDFQLPEDWPQKEAYEALCHIRDHSELANLWAENQNTYKEWRNCTRYLMVRINPADDIDTENDAYDIPSEEDFERLCLFCAEPIDNNNIFSTDLKKGLAEPIIISSAFCHHHCFKAAVHSRFRNDQKHRSC